MNLAPGFPSRPYCTELTGGTAPVGNQIHGSRILRNDPDLVWDQTGSGNSFRGNRCQTSTPAGLCRK